MRAANYVEETTTSIAGTNGNGAVTMTAIANVPRFSTVFGTQATTIRYVIEDTVNKKFETGIGSVSSNVLTRTRPQVTWDGTTYDDSTPSPIQFGSSPASGNIRIRMAATAEMQSPALMQGVNRTINTGDNTKRDFRLSGTKTETSNGTSGTKTANRLYYTAYLLEHSGLLDGISFEITSAVASSSVKWGIFDVGVDGLPNNRLALFNDVTTTTTGVKIDNATGTWSPAGPVWLNAGWYAIGILCSHAVSFLCDTGTPANTRQTPFGRENSYGYSDTFYVSRTFANGIPSVADMTGAVLVPAQSVDNGRIQIRMRVTP